MSEILTECSDAAGNPVVRLHSLGLSFGKTRALEDVTLDIPSGCMVGLIGPDGVGKSSLLSLVAGARVIREGRVEVLGGDMADRAHRSVTCPRIAYMPQGLGRNLYPSLSVRENVDFFGRLFGHGKEAREQRIALLLGSTGLEPFAERPVKQLSGGMKQKMGLCCALIHDPDLLILDEPTTGIDPLSRRQFWGLIGEIRQKRPGMSVIVATAYMEEAARFDWLVVMDAGRVLSTGTPPQLLARAGVPTLDDAFIALLPEERKAGHKPVDIPPRPTGSEGDVVIEAVNLTKRFGGFTAVDDVSFSIRRGEIFGFVGSNGCGKTTTMKMLTGLLRASGGTARLFGKEIDPGDLEARRRIGYMSQGFSLYSELTVMQNLDLHARMFGMPAEAIPARIAEMVRRFDLAGITDALPDALPLGMRQRLSLAVAMIHAPGILILDEPTSGVDPVARDSFWRMLSDLSRRDGVTIFVSTHLMNEAQLCDRVALMHAGRVLIADTPRAIMAKSATGSLDEAFVAHLVEEAEVRRPAEDQGSRPRLPVLADMSDVPHVSDVMHRRFDLRRLFAYSRRETLELLRDPIRASLAILGTLLLMFVIGYGINIDVENLSFAVLDRDGTTASRDYALHLGGSRYFTQKAPLSNHAELDRRMRSGELSLALEIPPNFARDVARGRPVEIGAWIDGAMPARAETVRGYVQGMHATWLAQKVRELRGDKAKEAFRMEVRYRYNPDVRSLVAMVPAVIPLLLLMIPAMLATLGVVREKELGSIINFYVTPVTRLEFLIGKQLPYVALGMLNFFTLAAFAVFAFRVPFTGSFGALTVAALLYIIIATSMGLVVSAFMKSQVAAIFATSLLTIVPAVQYSGIIDPVSSLQGVGAFIGSIYPTTHFVIISRGTFSKALGFGDLAWSFAPLIAAIPVLMALGAAFLRKQEA